VQGAVTLTRSPGFTDQLHVSLRHPDPLWLPVDQEVGGGALAAGAARQLGGGGVEVVGGVGDGGVEQQAEAPRGAVSAATMPVELGPQLQETAPVGLEIIKKRHRSPRCPSR